ncbi:MAG: hypothetical protein ACK4UJ_09000 [Leptonema sp. (in: bacteria)]
MTFLNSVFQLIEKGELSEASFILGEFLEKDPYNEDIISGYYSIKYWQNREFLLNQNHMNDSLLKEWSQFEDKLKEKNYKMNPITITIKAYIIRKIANQLKNKFEKEGLDNTDVDLLNQLAINLISIGEIDQAKEMLTYSKSIQSDNVQTLFLFGDLLCLESELQQDEVLISKGLSLIRDGYLLDNKEFPIHNMYSKILKDIYKELKFLYEEENRIQFWFSNFIMLKALQFDLRKLTADEILKIEEEIERLEKELENVPKKFYEKTIARLIFFYLVVVHSLIYHYSNEERLQILLENIKILSPKIFNDLIKILLDIQN